jgi:hypothetical protein
MEEDWEDWSSSSSSSFSFLLARLTARFLFLLILLFSSSSSSSSSCAIRSILALRAGSSPRLFSIIGSFDEDEDDDTDVMVALTDSATVKLSSIVRCSCCCFL